MKISNGLLALMVSVVVAGYFSTAAFAKSVTIHSLSSAPTIDGGGGEWDSVPSVTVPVDAAIPGDPKNPLGKSAVELKAGYHGNTIYLWARWKDPTENSTHKTFVWNKEAEKYDTGKDREDRLAIMFEMEGDFSSDMLSGKEYKADIWHWKAARSNPAGVAHDKMHVISKGKLAGAKEHPSKDGGTVWVQRPSDEGGKIYKSKRYAEHEGDTVPKYIVDPGVSGSIADVKAKGSWKDGAWTLEMGRKLDTGNTDDVRFQKGKPFKAALALFEHTGDDHHSVSSNMLFIWK